MNMNTHEAMASLEEDLKKVEAITFDDEKCGADQAMLHQYKNARDLYVYRAMVIALVKRVADGAVSRDDDQNTTTSIPFTEEEEKMAFLQERAESLMEQTVRDATSIRESMEILEAKRKYCALKRNEMELLLLDSEVDRGMMDFESHEEIDEEEIATKEQELAEYRKRQIEAEIQEKTLLAENERLKHEHQELVAKLPALLSANLPAEEARLMKENERLQQLVKEGQSNQRHYETTMRILEKLNGVRILQVDGSSEIPGMLHLQLKLLDEYDLKLILKVTKSNHLVVEPALFSPESLVFWRPTHATPTEESHQGVQ